MSEIHQPKETTLAQVLDIVKSRDDYPRLAESLGRLGLDMAHCFALAEQLEAQSPGTELEKEVAATVERVVADPLAAKLMAFTEFATEIGALGADVGNSVSTLAAAGGFSSRDRQVPQKAGDAPGVDYTDVLKGLPAGGSNV